MREFAADYLTRTRAGMWEDSREALEPLELEDRDRVLDVGCGTGELTRVLAAECTGSVIGCDADPRLLAVAAERGPVVTGDALRLPFAEDAFDLVTCQALLVNLPDPVAAVAEFARVSSDLVVAIEPDNGDVTVDSSVTTEASLERRARRAYVAGVETDATLGAAARDVFREAGLEVLETRRYDHVRSIEPPYDERALTAARRKATGAGLADDRETMLEGELTVEEYDRLRAAWREMGREVIDQMRDGAYTRSEAVPFYVTVGRA